jgi:hypothetical protein
MEATERDSTQDWLLPEGAVPPLLSELEQRIDEAVAIARSSERVAIAVGDAALDAAQQARRAAEIAERASAAALSATEPAPVPASETAVAAVVAEKPPRADTSPEDAALRSFSERADRVVARLRALERRPRWTRPASVGAAGRRPGG